MHVMIFNCYSVETFGLSNVSPHMNHTVSGCGMYHSNIVTCLDHIWINTETMLCWAMKSNIKFKDENKIKIYFPINWDFSDKVLTWIFNEWNKYQNEKRKS